MKFALKSMFSIVSLGCALFFAQPSFGQQTQATLTGQVSDPQGATIPNAEVTITNVDTAITRTAPTNGSGRYTVTNLNPGNYSVDVKASGFSEKILKGVVLAVGDEKSLDVALTLGGANDVVTVTAAAAVTDTVSSSQGTVVDNAEVVGLPLNQRTFYGLALLSPAAYLPGQNSTLGFRGGFNVAGNNETANTFTVNGIDDNDQNVMAPSFRPSVEGIQEFKLLTGVYSAEYGRTSGGQVVVITKTGTNAFHGDLFEFLRNSQFDAKNKFTLAGAPTTFRRNQFGGTLGGPIIKDKAFFFASYEGLRLRQPTVLTTFVPNPAFQTGDFSSVTAALTNPDPTSPYQFQTVNGRANQIDPRGLSPLGLAILKLYPAPDPGYSTANSAPQYTYNRARIENLDEGSGRLDYRITDKDTILVQYNYFTDPSFEPSNSLCGSGSLPGFGCTTNQISTLAGINYTRVLNEHWLNEFRVGFDRLEQPRTGEDVNLAFPKIPGAFSDPTIPSTINGGAPRVAVGSYATIHPYTNLPQHRYDNHYNIVDNVNWQKGNHAIKFGVNLVQARYEDLYVSYGTGSFNFTGASSAITTGNAASDLALGYATSSQRTPTAPDFGVRYNSYGGYIQDDWKVTSNLTLNLGVRYEYFSPTRETHNTLANWTLPNSANPSGTIAVAGVRGAGGKLYNDDLNNFGPRVGLAFQPYGNDKTVIHASYGVFYNSPAIGNGMNLTQSIQPPFRLNQVFTSSKTAGIQVQLDTNPFPSITADGSQAHPFTSVSPTGADINFRTLYMDEYGADIQRQLTPSMSLTIGYIGNEGAKIPRLVFPNQATATVAFTNGLASGVSSTRPLTATSGPVGINNQYYQYSTINYYISEGHSNFNALTVKAQQSSYKGLSMVLSYTWSHAIDNAPGYASGSQSSSGNPQNSNNLAAEKGTADFNVANRIVLSPVYELPFGKGKAFLSNGIGAAVAGGWQVSGIYSWQSGRPFTVYMSSNRSGTLDGSDRPNVTSNPNSGAPHTPAQWFNTSAFTANAYGTFGNEGRNAIIGPKYNNLDFGIQRNFALTERYSLAFRAEAFNLANKVNYMNPVGTSGGTTQFVATGTSLANTNTSFGKLTVANDPRSMQFSLKFLF